MTEEELFQTALELEDPQAGEDFILTDAQEYLACMDAKAATLVEGGDRPGHVAPELARKWLAADPALKAAVAERTVAFWREELAKPEEQREAEFWGMFGFAETPKPTVRFAGMNWVPLPRPEVVGNAS